MPILDTVELTGPYEDAPTWRPDQPGQETLCIMRWKHAREWIAATAPLWEPLALYRFGGTLARHRQTGILAEVRGDRLVNCNQSKAESALLSLRAGAHEE